MYTPLTEEQAAVMKSKVQHQCHLDTDEETYNTGMEFIGSIVCKRSLNKFKSGEVFNTVTGVVRNPYTMRWAFTFEEDDSCVEIKQINLKATQ